VIRILLVIAARRRSAQGDVWVLHHWCFNWGACTWFFRPTPVWVTTRGNSLDVDSSRYYRFDTVDDTRSEQTCRNDWWLWYSIKIA
jgi:hypothetical protein